MMHDRTVISLVLLLMTLTACATESAQSDNLGAGNKPPPGASDGQRLAERPLVIPTLQLGERCPESDGTTPIPTQTLRGSGPVYPHYSADGRPIAFGQSEQTEGWYYVKILWLIEPGVNGPILIRGRQLDGPGELRFGDGGSPEASMLIGVDTPAAQDLPKGWREMPSFTRIKEPGCYAWQLDGPDFTSLVVFQAIK